MKKPLPLPPAEVQDAALSTFTNWVAAIADRVNNPVASVLAGLSLVQREIEQPSNGVSLDPQLVAATLDRIKIRLMALAEYVQELRNFGHPDTFTPVGVALSTVLATVIRECETRGELRGEVEVVLNVPMVVADYSRLKVALHALILNGWEAAARSERRCVRFSSNTAAGGVEITVEDNGPGFSVAAMARAGEPFFSTKEAGTGLGLAIVRKFVASHGGSFEIASSSSLGGAKVTLLLPMKLLEVKS